MRNLIAFILLILPTSFADAELRYFLLEITQMPIPDKSDPKVQGLRDPASISSTSEEENQSSPTDNQSLTMEPQKVDTPKKPKSRLVTTSLDPLQYKKYYPLQDNESLKLVDTWMCRGPTNMREPCASPRTRPKTQSSIPEAVPSAASGSDQLQ